MVLFYDYKFSKMGMQGNEGIFCMLFQHFARDLIHQVLFLYILPQPSYELERLALEDAHTLVQN